MAARNAGNPAAGDKISEVHPPLTGEPMHTKIDDLLARMHALEEELQSEFARKREEIGFLIENKRVRFAREVLEKQHLARLGIWRFLRNSRISVALTAPLIYSGFIPFALMDLFVTLYQRTCFPVYGIPRVRRADYMAFDRGDLPYLNAIERFNCFYCSYGNGVAAYLREVAARTEQSWCPIKHARRIVAAHERYPRFFEFGDAEAYRKGLERIRHSYGTAPAATDEATPPAQDP
jgi:hypothetical protein